MLYLHIIKTKYGIFECASSRKKKQECFCFLLVKERSCFRKHRAVKCLLETRVFLPKQF